MEMIRQPFTVFLTSAFDKGDYTTDDSIAFVLPLFRKVLALHEAGQVAPFEKEGTLFVPAHTHSLDIDETLAHPPTDALAEVNALFPRQQTRGLDLVREPLQHATWLPGYRCFEQGLGHHDPQTDIFCLGLILGSMALGLDLHNANDLQEFIRLRANPSLHHASGHPTIHPILGALITEMTELDRSRRTQDLYEAVRRLEHYRDYDPERQIDLGQIAGWMHTELKQRDVFILNRLRNRLFDTSRRNRLLYYKPNKRFVNLTVSSVPMVLHYQSIRPELLFTWNDQLGRQIVGMKEIVLNKYLRFDDHPYLPAALDRVRVDSQRAIQEYGLSPLKLVIAFLSWNNLKEDPKERIQSPLLLLPVTLKKNRRLKEDHYVIKALDNAAEVNPVLAGQLKELYGIRLPDLIDLEEISPEQFYKSVSAQIDAANQGITLRYIGRPRIRLIHREARQIVNQYTREPQAGSRRPSRPSLRLSLLQDIHFLDSPPDPTVAPDLPYVPVPVDLVKFRQQAAGPEQSTGPEQRTGPDSITPELFELAESENNPYSWDFDVCYMVLGNFNYKKMSLVRDYNLVIDQQIQHHVFDAFFNDQPRTFTEHHFDGNRMDDWFHVITADPAQTKAILQSRAGYSYIIQGPPGTGKSQTITNLIADFVARGKNILFVCEKRAALDVVYHRLKQVGLEELCCYIHDSQGDKREFIRNLKATYEDFTRPGKDLATIRNRRQSLLEKMNGHLDILREFHTTSTAEAKETGIEVRQLIEKIIGLRQHLAELSPREEEALPSYREWQESLPLIAVLEATLEETGSDPVFAEHPFSRIAETIFHLPNPHQALDEALRQSLQRLEEVDTGFRNSGLPPEQTADPEQMRSLVQFAVLLHPLARAGHLGMADPDREEARVLQREMQHYRQLHEVHRQCLQRNSYWDHKLNEQDMENALTIAGRQEGAFLGFLNGSWQRLRRQLQQDYDFSRHTVKPSFRSILESLKAEYAAAGQVAETRRQLQEKYGQDNIDTSWLSLEVLYGKKGHPQLDYLLRHPQGAALTAALQALHQPLNRLETQLRQCLQDPAAGSLSATRDQLRNILMNTEALGDFLPAMRSFTTLPSSVKKALRDFPLRPVQLEAAIARAALRQLYQTNRAFANIDRSALERAAQQLGQGYTALQQVNAEYIRTFVRQRFLQQIDLANMAASQLNEEQKKFKKIYNEGRKILENEFGKSMRYKSIRELSAKESGLVLKDIKPVWLMSPYSVSDSLPLDFDHFDVVIFDEASQITLEEGIPALYRSRQTIVVGDEKQMPPTDFFSAAAKDNDPDDLEGIEEGEGDEWLSDDADSLLAQGARKLNSVLLSWHYRSHYETLISFSNHAFYEGELLTIPDKTIHHRESTPITIARPEEAAEKADCLFDRSISYHFHPEGLYEKRSNASEATYIAHLVRELFRRDTKESLGIVAFSQEQQHRIEIAFDELAAQDAVFAQKLEEAYNRTENDQFTGLIVKNLENIQGDERDIIIMSVCYGFDARGKMLMNFGPVNKRGGEKRLNVLFSRARIHMAVVSSIRFEHITNEYNEGANYLRRFLQYAEMISLGRMDAARTILDSLVLYKEDRLAGVTPTLIRRQIMEQIRAMGYEVAEQVGQSDFKCSLAVKARPADSEYSLGILLDDEQHYRNSNLIEQYYQRPAILRTFGWRILPVLSRDWLHQPQKVMEQIRTALTTPEPPAEPPSKPSAEPPALSPELPPAFPAEGKPLFMPSPDADSAHASGLATSGKATSYASTDSDVPASPASAYDHLDFRRLTYNDAGSDKFWETATDGNKLIVRWGRNGTRGQIQLKTFPDEEAAQKEKERLIKEKLGKGYR